MLSLCLSLTVEINECHLNENKSDYLFTVTCRVAQRQAAEQGSFTVGSGRPEVTLISLGLEKLQARLARSGLSYVTG